MVYCIYLVWVGISVILGPDWLPSCVSLALNIRGCFVGSHEILVQFF